MGRDVVSMHLDKKPNAVIVSSNGASDDSVQDSPTFVGVDGQANDSAVEEQHGNQDVLGVKSTNGEAGFTKGKASRSEAQKSSDKKLSSPVKGDVQTKATSPQSSRKPLQPDYRKHFDDDNWSVASSTAASVRTVKFKTTVPVAPTFRIVDRAERRREFQSKLEEKRQALEKEKMEYEARTKEEEQAAIKQLRKAMVVRANPVPTFYQEGPPPKTELKKLPLTRAKSPKLTRRKSYPDAAAASSSSSSVESKGLTSRGTRRSLGSSTTPAASPLKTKEQRNAAPSASKIKDRAKSAKESVKTTPHKMAEQRNAAADIAVSS